MVFVASGHSHPLRVCPPPLCITLCLVHKDKAMEGSPEKEPGDIIIRKRHM